MDEGTEGRVKRIEELVEENHKILKRMQHAVRWNRLFWLIKWVVLVATALFGYYYLQPYVDTLVKTYETVQQQIGTIKDTASKATGFFGN